MIVKNANSGLGSFVIPERPDEDVVKELLSRLNRCPECGGDGYVMSYIGGGLQEVGPCNFCLAEFELFWDDNEHYLRFITGLAKEWAERAGRLEQWKQRKAKECLGINGDGILTLNKYAKL